jgi:hypothetical protein
VVRLSLQLLFLVLRRSRQPVVQLRHSRQLKNPPVKDLLTICHSKLKFYNFDIFSCRSHLYWERLFIFWKSRRREP